MTRLLAPVLLVAALAASATPALAQSPRTADRAAVLQSVMVCGTDAASRIAYQRDHGAAPTFVTAQQAVAAHQAGQRWAAPRCMTVHQYGRLAGTPQQRASL